MRLKAQAWFRTTVTVGGVTSRWAGVEGQTFDVPDEVGAALLADLPGILVPVVDGYAAPDVVAGAITAATEAIVEMVEVPPEVAPKARTRQVARKPAAKRGK